MTATVQTDMPVYTGAQLDRIAFPLGGIGAGMVCLEGAGSLTHVSIRNRPEFGHEPLLFAAISAAPAGASPPRFARLLEGPVPEWKRFGPPGSGLGGGGTSHGLPRFAAASFEARFPFAKVKLDDAESPFTAELTAWSPFEPGQADDSSLPFAALEYRFANRTAGVVEAVFSYHAANFPGAMTPRGAIRPLPGGLELWGAGRPDEPWTETGFAVTSDDPAVRVNHAWFRGGWWDHLVMAWADVENGSCYERPPLPETDPTPAPGATLFIPFVLASGERKTISIRLAWFAGVTDLRFGSRPDPHGSPPETPGPAHRPWYATRFADLREASRWWSENYPRLRGAAQRFGDCLHDTTLPPEVIETVTANLGILRSPTVLRQADGRLWAWEGCDDQRGSCAGSCTHVWNYAQALPHLFPELERTLRETEFEISQDERGHQMFRTALPIRPTPHDFHAAADGQLGGIMKVHREWRISGDTAWLRRLWPRVRASLDYAIATWDPARRGWFEEPWHNTYDIEFWGPDGLSSSFYLGALQAAVAMGQRLGDDVAGYAALAERAKGRLVELFNGEYFIQRVLWRDRRAGDPARHTGLLARHSAEAVTLVGQEGPGYQYGSGCLSDGVLGAWMAAVCGLEECGDRARIRSHLQAVHRHNFQRRLEHHANAARAGFAGGGEGGLLLCSWPRQGRPQRPLVYAAEVWTGVEHQVASHLLMHGAVEEAREILSAVRRRYDGRRRNPYDEYECGHWYARALSSYALLQGWTGARFDAVDRVLHLRPSLAGDFRSFLAWEGGYGTVGVRGGEPFLDVVAGSIGPHTIAYVPFQPDKTP